MALSGPFIIKPNTAYMEVPSCHTCKWWWRDNLPIDENTGVCVAGGGSASYVGYEWPQDRQAKMWTDCGENTIRTAADFGCVQHEPRETRQALEQTTCTHDEMVMNIGSDIFRCSACSYELGADHLRALGRLTFVLRDDE